MRKKEKFIFTQHDKYRKAFAVAKQLASVCSGVSTREYPNYLEAMEKLLKNWTAGKRVVVDVLEDENDDNEYVAVTANVAKPEVLRPTDDSNEEAINGKAIAGECTQGKCILCHKMGGIQKT